MKFDIVIINKHSEFNIYEIRIPIGFFSYFVSLTSFFMKWFIKATALFHISYNIKYLNSRMRLVESTVTAIYSMSLNSMNENIEFFWFISSNEFIFFFSLSLSLSLFSGMNKIHGRFSFLFSCQKLLPFILNVGNRWQKHWFAVHISTTLPNAFAVIRIDKNERNVQVNAMQCNANNDF